MSRRPRIDRSGFTQHLVQRDHNRDPILCTREDFQLYLSCLSEAARRNGCEVHAYVLMTNHVHLLRTPSYFTQPAKGEVRNHLWRIGLRDYDNLVAALFKRGLSEIAKLY